MPEPCHEAGSGSAKKIDPRLSRAQCSTRSGAAESPTPEGGTYIGQVAQEFGDLCSCADALVLDGPEVEPVARELTDEAGNQGVVGRAVQPDTSATPKLDD